MSKTYTILIVDDNEAAADGLQKLLEYGGHKVLVAYTGAAALEQARAQCPEVILLDIGLPDISGYELAKQLNKEKSPHPLLIALSGYSQQEDKDRAIEAGFDHYLVKPVSVKEIETLLSQKKSGDPTWIPAEF